MEKTKIWVYEEYIYLSDKYVKHSLDGGQADIFLFEEAENVCKKVEERVKHFCEELGITEEEVERSLDSWFLTGYLKDIKQNAEIMITINQKDVR